MKLKRSYKTNKTEVKPLLKAWTLRSIGSDTSRIKKLNFWIINGKASKTELEKPWETKN